MVCISQSLLISTSLSILISFDLDLSQSQSCDFSCDLCGDLSHDCSLMISLSISLLWYFSCDLSSNLFPPFLTFSPILVISFTIYHFLAMSLMMSIPQSVSHDLSLNLFLTFLPFLQSLMISPDLFHSPDIFYVISLTIYFSFFLCTLVISTLWYLYHNLFLINTSYRLHWDCFHKLSHKWSQSLSLFFSISFSKSQCRCSQSPAYILISSLMISLELSHMISCDFSHSRFCTILISLKIEIAFFILQSRLKASSYDVSHAHAQSLLWFISRNLSPAIILSISHDLACMIFVISLAWSHHLSQSHNLFGSLSISHMWSLFLVISPLIFHNRSLTQSLLC